MRRGCLLFVVAALLAVSLGAPGTAVAQAPLGQETAYDYNPLWDRNRQLMVIGLGMIFGAVAANYAAGAYHTYAPQAALTLGPAASWAGRQMARLFGTGWWGSAPATAAAAATAAPATAATAAPAAGAAPLVVRAPAGAGLDLWVPPRVQVPTSLDMIGGVIGAVTAHYVFRAGQWIAESLL